jgi:hypothetical protein
LPERIFLRDSPDARFYYDKCSTKLRTSYQLRQPSQGGSDVVDETAAGQSTCHSRSEM